MIPSYEEIKALKEHKVYDLYSCSIGGNFRLSINEVDGHSLSIDYLSGGYLAYPTRKFESNFKFSKVYKLNKKNYQGLVELYNNMLYLIIEEINDELKKNIA